MVLNRVDTLVGAEHYQLGDREVGLNERKTSSRSRRPKGSLVP